MPYFTGGTPQDGRIHGIISVEEGNGVLLILDTQSAF